MEKRGFILSLLPHVHVCIRGIDFSSFYDFDIILKLLRHCVMFCFSFYWDSKKIIFVSRQKNVIVYIVLLHIHVPLPWEYSCILPGITMAYSNGPERMFTLFYFLYKTFFISIIYVNFYNASPQHEQWWYGQEWMFTFF